MKTTLVIRKLVELVRANRTARVDFIVYIILSSVMI